MPIDKAVLDEKLAALATPGVSGRRENSLVVSLTSFPARMDTLRYALYSLLTQTRKPDLLVLWLASEEFPGGERDVPHNILKLRDNGLTIQWTKNTRPYKKLIPSLAAYPDSVIVTADDDAFYAPDWLERLHGDYLRHNRETMVYGHRVHKIAMDRDNLYSYGSWTQASRNRPGASFLNFATGMGGVLYPPGALHGNVFEERLFLSLTPNNDDIWFWAMAVLNGTPIKLIDNFLIPEDLVPEDLSGSLYPHNGPGGGNDRQMAAVLGAFPDIVDKLRAELRALERL